MRSAFIALAAWAAPALGLVVLEELPSVPHGWVPSGRVSDSTPMRLHAALKYQNLNLLEQELKAVSEPCSPFYGKYQDVGPGWKYFPSKDSESKVHQWLQQNGATDIQSDGDTVSFSTTAGKASSMMNADFQVYKRGSESKLRTTAYSVPDDLANHIDLISPTTYFGALNAHAPVVPEKIPVDSLEEQVKRDNLEKRDYINTSCLTTYTSKRTGRVYEALTPECVKELYNTKGYTPNPKSGSTIAFANFLGESPSYSDLKLFEQEFKLPPASFEIKALINGGVNDQNPATESDGEANLDVQNIVGVVNGLPVSTYITGGVAPINPDLLSPNQSSSSNEPYIQFFSYLLAQPNSKLPYVISISYGDHEKKVPLLLTVPDKYAARVCNQIGMMGLRGRSVLSSTGDEGTGAVCRANPPPGGALDSGHPEFTPQFPATCPYITAVGGTQAYNPEIAWNATGSGFSRYFKTAWYQETAVSTYLNKYINPEAKAYYTANNYTDFSGRGVPDVSAHSLFPYYLIYVNGSRALSGGTSAAAPVFSSVVALLNDARLRAGKPALGFLNPWLYSSASALDDVTSGIVVGCAGTNLQSGQPVPGAGIIPYASWNATKAWDPATGLGTPDFQKMKAAALAGCNKYGKPPGYGGH